MSTIHIATPDGQRNQFTEEEFKALLDKKTFERGTLYWKEGMSDWKSVEDWSGSLENDPYRPTSIPEMVAPVVANLAQTPPRKMGGLTTALVIFLSLSLVTEVLSLMSNTLQYQLLSRPFSVEEAEANDIRAGLVGLLHLVVYLPTAILFLCWVSRSTANNHSFGARNLTFTPGWAIGYYFVPIVSLFRPYQNMQETWKVSKDPSSWQSLPGSSLVGWWWGLYILESIVSQIYWRMGRRQEEFDIEMLKSETGVGMISSLISIPLCIVAILVVRSIGNRQQQRILNLDEPKPFQEQQSDFLIRR